MSIQWYRGAFNGAAVSQRRKQALRPHKLRMKIPSMGPPFLNGGNRARAALHAPEASPSMGPPFLNGGNFNCRVANGSPITTFNGAAVSQRRKRGVLSAEEQAAQHLQWGRRFSTAETPWDCRQIRGHRITFNGAAVSQRRKQEGQQATAARIDILQWGRRFSTAETRHDRDGTDGGFSFNGAAVSQRRKLICFRVSFNCVVPLQWGRRFSTAETC